MIEDRIPCPNCGFLNKPDAQFCELCGEPLPPEAKEKLEEKKPFVFPSLPELPVKDGRLDFYEVISRNKRNTVLLVFLFIMLFAAVGGAIGYLYGNYRTGLMVSSGVAILWVMVALIWGKDISLSFVGAGRVSPEEEPILHHVVEEMSIAAGISKPAVYVVETKGMNAFSTGFSPENSSVAVTRGMLENLSREELQAVIGHEISHIRFYDTRLMITVTALAGLIVIFSDIALRGFIFIGGRRSWDESEEFDIPFKGNIIITLLLLGFVALSPVIAFLLQMAISRKREFIADAGSVELTRNPAGLRKTLEKLLQGNVFVPSASKGNQHLFIVNPLKEDADIKDTIFETHPPLRKRIEILKRMEA